MKNLISAFMVAMCISSAFASDPGERLSRYIDPRIGSEGLGRVYIGPATPFGMVRPGPDCTPGPNSGWLPMPERVDGFAQTHVSGTGGGPKYGNILIQPYIGDFSATSHISYRAAETIECGYYATTFKGSGIEVEITTAPRASVYRITYPEGLPADSLPSLLVDAGFFLGESPVPDAREAQQLVGSEIAVTADNEICGYSRIRGGWNNGRAYTVYFCAETTPAFADYATWEGRDIARCPSRADHGAKTGAMVVFPAGTRTVDVRVGISFISVAKARENLLKDTSGKTFDEVRAALLDSWDELLSRVTIDESSPEALKRMFYTGLYHTMLMPSDRTGENPLWTDPGVPYYDDFYAIWDTYRTSMPLITLIDPERQADMVNSLVNIGKRDGYMPDARSGNANGRTQGGSNADVVVADAFVKHLPGIDYEAALEQMLKDAETDPGYDHEAHGRGGLTEYKTLGYVPYGVPRAGNRTVEYSLCDYGVAQVARGLGHDSVAAVYETRSHNWRNLWNPYYEHDGAKGFIMPRDAEGKWLNSLPYGHSRLRHPHFKYTPVTFEGPWYTPWWNMFFYEASSWEYSLSMPHDVPALIEACGGPAAFERRLDTFFDHGYYNVNNEPSFLSPCLYHWIGKPWKSTQRVRSIVADHFGDSAAGLPGNDDSGAMSSWLAFHIMGLYPNAGMPYYLINSPMVKSSTIGAGSERPFRIIADKLSNKNIYIQKATLNGRDYPWSTIHHDSIMAGGELRLVMGPKPGKWGRSLAPGVDCEVPVTELPAIVPSKSHDLPVMDAVSSDTVKITYYLHGQKRRFRMVYYRMSHGGVALVWGIERNLKWWEGCYYMTAEAVKHGTQLSLLMPEDGNYILLSGDETFGMVSRDCLRNLVDKGQMILDGVEYSFKGRTGDTLEAVDNVEGARMWILDNPELPIIMKMENNPLEIDWEVQSIIPGRRAAD